MQRDSSRAIMTRAMRDMVHSWVEVLGIVRRKLEHETLEQGLG